MANDSDIRQALSYFIGQRVGTISIVCTVDSVDYASQSCYCIPVNGDADIMDVRLIAQTGNGFILIPKSGSNVVVTFIDDKNAYVAMFSELDEIQINGITLGGLTKTLELQLQLNKMNAQLQAVISAISTWPVAPGDGGAAFKSTFAGLISGKMPGDFSNIENTTVKQGDGT